METGVLVFVVEETLKTFEDDVVHIYIRNTASINLKEEHTENLQEMLIPSNTKVFQT